MAKKRPWKGHKEAREGPKETLERPIRGYGWPSRGRGKAKRGQNMNEKAPFRFKYCCQRLKKFLKYEKSS